MLQASDATALWHGHRLWLMDGTSLSQRYLWSEAIDQLLAAEEPSTSASPTVVYPLTDHLGTARDLAT